jgi:hypothetical protein
MKYLNALNIYISNSSKISSHYINLASLLVVLGLGGGESGGDNNLHHYRF